jgi:hypothetical protein
MRKALKTCSLATMRLASAAPALNLWPKSPLPTRASRGSSRRGRRYRQRSALASWRWSGPQAAQNAPNPPRRVLTINEARAVAIPDWQSIDWPAARAILRHRMARRCARCPRAAPACARRRARPCGRGVRDSLVVECSRRAALRTYRNRSLAPRALHHPLVAAVPAVRLTARQAVHRQAWASVPPLCQSGARTPTLTGGGRILATCRNLSRRPHALFLSTHCEPSHLG